MVGIVASRPICPGFDSKRSQKNFRGNIVNYQQICLEKSGQRLENVDRTHLVLASGKLVLKNELD